MKRFRFKLQGVLDHRQRIEDLRKREFAVAARAVVERRTRIVGLEEQIASGREALAADTEGQIDSQRVIAHRRYLGHLGLQIGHLQQELLRAERSLETERTALVEASRARRVLEQLRTRKRAEYQVEADRQEQRETDEIALHCRDRASLQGQERRS